MNQEEILEALDESRERVLTVVAELPDSALTHPNAIDNQWTVADLLVHITVWEAELVTALMRLQQNRKPGKLLQAMANEDEFNAKVHGDNRGRDLDRIFDDLHHSRLQLEEWIPEFSNKALTDHKRYKWLKGQALWEIIKINSFGHEQMHIAALEAFAEQWLANENLISPNDIPLLGE